MAGDREITDILQPIRQKHDVPALAMAVVTSAGIKWQGVVGVRKRGEPVPAELTDAWHLGSDGKIMTSTLIARLVERGILNWETNLAAVFPAAVPQMDPGFRSVNLLQLLSHRAGLPANLDLRAYAGTNVAALRRAAVYQELRHKPQTPPGTHFSYSNLGYILAAAMAEQVTGRTWEELMRSEVFEPLQMTSAGFGGLGTVGKIDAPWPHGADGTPRLFNGPGQDNPPVMGPAGRIHCSLADWAKFIQDQLRGARGQAGLLQPASYQRLQTPPLGGDYALGWGVTKRSWGGGIVFNHVGDNTMNCADVWVAPAKDFAVLVCVNQGGEAALAAADAAVAAWVTQP